MNYAAREEYLTTEVMTAAPQKLQLLLLDAAILLGGRAKRHWSKQEHEPAFEALVHCQRIVTQLINGLAPNFESAVVRQMAAVYGYVYRTIVLATANRDAQKLDEAMRVLDAERETWRQVCERLGTRRVDAVSEAIAAPVFARAPLDLQSTTSTGDRLGGFSFEA